MPACIQRFRSMPWLLTVVALALMAQPGPRVPIVRGVRWVVTSPSDSATDGNLATHSGSLRFTLAHATAGDTVAFNYLDVGADTIFVNSTLSVPAGVTVGRARWQRCGSYTRPLVNLETTAALNPVLSLGAGATLRNIDIGGGTVSLRITGTTVDLCGLGLGIMYDADGVATTLPPLHAAIIVDGPRATVHQNDILSAIVVTTQGSGARIGDALGQSGNGNSGVRDASVSVLADAAGAAQRVTIRDPFPRSLEGMVGSGVSGGDDVITHANNWAQTPTILRAYSTDNFATAHVVGQANPLSSVDVFFDNGTTVARQTPIRADTSGAFSFVGPLRGSSVKVSVASTLLDPAHANRIGSSSQLSPAVAVVAGSGPANALSSPRTRIEAPSRSAERASRAPSRRPGRRSSGRPSNAAAYGWGGTRSR